MNLAQLPVGVAATVVSVSPPPDAPEWGEWLEAIGFLPGERVAIVAATPLGRDPLVVRVGDSTFALRQVEAACIGVQA
jgi:ferrous iron transport protein A